MSKVSITVLIALAAMPVPAFAQSAFSDEARVEDSALNRVAGREDFGQIALANQVNQVRNNAVIGNSTTGGVQIDGNAFQNLSGLAVISANSGNNVAINSALNVTISLSSAK